MATMTTDILILGAGLGGYAAFQTLKKELHTHGLSQKITIVDQHNYFSFTPMHHEVASGSIEPAHCTIPMRELTHNTPHTFLRARVIAVHPEEKRVETTAGDIRYAYCVVALGSTINYGNIPGAETHSHHVRHLPNAIALHDAMIRACEGTTKEINVCIVGGGATGVEMAGQFAYLLKRDIRRLYPEKKTSVSLVQYDATLVPHLPKALQKAVHRHLKKMGVSIHLSSAVKEVRQDAILLHTGLELPSTITIWTAGFHNIGLHILPESWCDRGRIPVTAHMTHPRSEHLYAIGDIAFARNPGDEQPLPQLGEVAHDEGRYVGNHIARTIRNKTMKPFVYRSKGTLLPIGDWYGIGTIGPFLLNGLFAWWLRRTVYVLLMPKLSRKIRIVVDWTLRLFGFSSTVLLDNRQDR